MSLLFTVVLVPGYLAFLCSRVVGNRINQPAMPMSTVVQCSQSTVSLFFMQVKVIVGENRDTVGNLISIDGVDGVLKTEQGEFSMFQLRHLCKMAKNT